MKKLVLLSFLSVLTACGVSKPTIKQSETSMDRLTSVTKIWDHQIIHELPIDWRVRDSQQKGNVFTQLYLPADVSVSNWNRNFQVIAMKFKESESAEKRKQAVKGIVQSQAIMILMACRDNKAYLDLGEKDVGGDLYGYHMIFGCKKATKDMPRLGLKKDTGEVVYTYGISAENSLYIIQSSVKGSDLNIDDKLIEEKVKNHVQQFLPITLCPVGGGSELCQSVTQI